LDPLTSSTAGAITGNYLAGVVGYLGAYLLLTRGVETYTAKNAAKDAYTLMKKCLPLAVFAYATHAPIPAALVSLGLSPQLAAAINSLWGILLYTGVAKVAANDTIKENRS